MQSRKERVMSGEAWCTADVAAQQRALVDEQIASQTWPQAFGAFMKAIESTNCPGSILEYGCASGYGREVLDRGGIPYRSYTGIDISEPALAIARERYPESRWLPELGTQVVPRSFDITIDGCSLIHRTDGDEWKEHVANMCAASRRWVILHRIPLAEQTERFETKGYGQSFPALRLGVAELEAEMQRHGFTRGLVFEADAGTMAIVFSRPRVFATYFDAQYWTRARTMWATLQKHMPHVELHALCWDSEAYDKANAAGMRATPVDAFLAEWPALAIDALPGPRRTRTEHMWSVGPQWVEHVMRQTGEPVTYVDADVAFFSSPEPVFAEIGGARAGVIPHGFAPRSAGLPGPTVESHGVFGTFNVGIVHFGDKAVAEDWASECRDWCFDRIEQAPVQDRRMRYGDQAYLDAWPERFGAHVVTHPGAMAAPWNIHARALDVRGGVPHRGGRPVVSYHYSALQLLPHGADVLTRPEYFLNDRQAEILYRPYLKQLMEA
jgi:hypothetical protein